MNKDFIKIKDTEGTLLLSHTNGKLSCNVTTKEIILQRPHCTYQILFENIISMVPHTLKTRHVTFPTPGNEHEKVTTSFASSYYKIRTGHVRIHNRSGVHEKGETDFIVPLSELFLNYFARYSKLTVVQ
ncbi:hypothetical protein AM501_17900 [Aneurinibacillus migulanus]|uniref:hypothetical protein n=1 Tax=Aneurinibacillus migulanus TaxID=47500 RepID=UPI0005BA6E6D|nr:hypothetical protein [Aneurinibacillus migulanus]KIV51051.1 hypothetical protein TS64_26350 [Aneurinibacillus migulanus]KPD07061.1 hypothetical protein AM501_17900 [Aneurinibacillus migulanus]CEH31829.1 Uncharacterized protein BN1090_A2_04320 [Aneurinibacillus migulanus]